MNILVVDDQRIFRHFPNLSEPGPKDVIVHATTSQEALDLLDDHDDWDELWLDHDLGMESRDSGWGVVKHILERETLPNIGRIYVHTMNPVGGDRMLKSLSHFYQVSRIDPTPYLDFEAMYEKKRNPWLAGPRR